MKILTACLIVLAAPVYAQTTQTVCQNDGYTIVCEKKVVPTVTPTIPPSLYDGQYRFQATEGYIPHWGYGTPAAPAPPPYAPLAWPTVYSPAYYGSFIPLTPDGPLINTAFAPPFRPATPRTAPIRRK